MGTMLPLSWREDCDCQYKPLTEKEKKAYLKEKEEQEKRWVQEKKKRKSANNQLGILVDEKDISVIVFEKEVASNHLILLVKYCLEPNHLKSTNGFVYIIYKDITWEQLQKQGIIYSEFRQIPNLQTPIAFIEYSEKSKGLIEALKKMHQTEG